jgi:hypothetical protein
MFLILAMIGKEMAGVRQESFLFENVVFLVKWEEAKWKSKLRKMAQ